MGKFKAFLSESYAELKKVVWPSQDEVISSTKVVVVSTLIFSLFFGVVDFILYQGLYLIF